MLNWEYIPIKSLKNRVISPGLFLLLFILASVFSVAQDGPDPTFPINKPGYKVRAEIINGDTVPVVDLPYVYVYTDYVFKNRRHYEQWTRIKYNVKKVYPYAILAAAKLKEYDRILEHMPDPKVRKAYLSV